MWLENTSMFMLGDTLSVSPGIEFERMPSLQPEHFGVLQNADMSRNKQFMKGVAQMAEEGVVQVYVALDGVREPILGAVGRLQFDVVESRLLQEYGV